MLGNVRRGESHDDVRRGESHEDVHITCEVGDSHDAGSHIDLNQGLCALCTVLMMSEGGGACWRVIAPRATGAAQVIMIPDLESGHRGPAPGRQTTRTHTHQSLSLAKHLNQTRRWMVGKISSLSFY